MILCIANNAVFTEEGADLGSVRVGPVVMEVGLREVGASQSVDSDFVQSFDLGFRLVCAAACHL